MAASTSMAAHASASSTHASVSSTAASVSSGSLRAVPTLKVITEDSTQDSSILDKSRTNISFKLSWLAGYHFMGKEPAYVTQHPLTIKPPKEDAKGAPKYKIGEYRFGIMPQDVKERFLPSNRDQGNDPWTDHNIIVDYLWSKVFRKIQCNRRRFGEPLMQPDQPGHQQYRGQQQDYGQEHTELTTEEQGSDSEEEESSVSEEEDSSDSEQEMVDNGVDRGGPLGRVNANEHNWDRNWLLQPEPASRVFAPHNGRLMWAGLSIASRKYWDGYEQGFIHSLVKAMRPLNRALPAQVNQTCTMTIRISDATHGVRRGAGYDFDLLTLKKFATIAWVGQDYLFDCVGQTRRSLSGREVALTDYSKLGAGDFDSALDESHEFDSWVQPVLDRLEENGETERPSWWIPLMIMWGAGTVDEFVDMMAMSEEGRNLRSALPKLAPELEPYEDDLVDAELCDQYDAKAPGQGDEPCRLLVDFSDFGRHEPNSRKTIAIRGLQASLSPYAIFLTCTLWNRLVRFARDSTQLQFHDLMTKVADGSLESGWEPVQKILDEVIRPLDWRRITRDFNRMGWSANDHLHMRQCEKGWGTQVVSTYQPRGFVAAEGRWSEGGQESTLDSQGAMNRESEPVEAWVEDWVTENMQRTFADARYRLPVEGEELRMATRQTALQTSVRPSSVDLQTDSEGVIRPIPIRGRVAGEALSEQGWGEETMQPGGGMSRL